MRFSRFRIPTTLPLLLPVLFCTASSAFARDVNCGFEKVAVEGEPVEAERACAALERVLEAFEAMGFRIEPEIRLVFKDQVMVELNGEEGKDEVELLQVSALFDSRRKLIEMTSFESGFQKDRHPWGIEWGQEIAESILHHELAHMATFAVLGDGYWHTGRAWLEYIAYSVEFEVMDASLSRRILAQNAATQPFGDVWEVNAITYSVDPDMFGLRSHLMTQANGGLEFVRRILADEVAFSRSDIIWRR